MFINNILDSLILLETMYKEMNADYSHNYYYSFIIGMNTKATPYLMGITKMQTLKNCIQSRSYIL